MPWYEHFISVGSGLFWGIVLFGIPYAAVYGLISLGGRFHQQGRLDAAARLLGSLHFLPMPAGLRGSLGWHLGRARIGQGKTEEGLRAFDRAVRRLDPAQHGADIAAILADRADALDAMGRREDAIEVRHRALEHLEDVPDDAERDIARALLLAGARRTEEAFASLTRALERTPERKREKRAEVMAWLAMTSFGANRTEEALAWADRSLADISDATWRAVLEETAVEAVLELRRFEDALERVDRALAGSSASRAPLGHLDRLRGTKMHAEYYLGRIDEARATMERIMERETRIRALLLSSRIHALNGAWDASRDELRAAREMFTGGVTPRIWWMPAMAALYMAEVAAETGQADEARAEMASGMKALGADEGAERWLHAMAAWLYARIGDQEAARRSIAEATQRWEQVEGFPIGNRARMDLARAFEVMGDFAQARDLWHEYFERGPAPVEVPEACYRLGRCHEALGEADAARAAYAQAAAPGLDTYYARQSESRLRQMGLPIG